MYFGGTIMTFALPLGAFIVISIALYYLFRSAHSGPRLKYLTTAPFTSVGTREPGPVPAPAVAAARRRRLPSPRRPPTRSHRSSPRQTTDPETAEGKVARSDFLANRARDGGWPCGRPASGPADPPGGGRRARRADQAADHRAAARHHRADDAARPARPAVAHARRGHRRRRHLRRRQREHLQLLHRPRHRRGDEADLAPPAGQQAGRDQADRGPGLGRRARRGRHGAARPGGQLARGGPRRRGHRLLRLRLHAAAQAPLPGQHRDRRRRGLLPRPRRLGRGQGHGGDPRDRAVRGDLPVDPAALLGAGDEVQGRLRARRTSRCSRWWPRPPR